MSPAAGMRVHVMTRGTGMREEFAFLGAQPARFWWRGYRDATNFQLPSLIVESDDAGWRLYLSPVAISAVGPGGTAISLVVVVEGPHGEDDDLALLPRLVALWSTGQDGQVARALSTAFPPDGRLITEWRATPDEATRRLVEAAFREGLRALPAPEAVDDGHRTDLPRWAGPADAAPSRTAFTHRVRELLDGAPGRAVLANYCREEDVLDGLTGFPVLADPADEPLALLVQRSGGALGERPVPLPAPAAPGKARPRPPVPEPIPPTGEHESDERSRHPVVLLVLCGLMAITIVAIILLLG
ncbi:hypothetical protein ABZ816_02265 [Actinosynnema sp. NPDC047251]|uniref:hypothetical protein n=1 Tax=Saccharothrix espanaensis TaxID=103731 RepID=UPI0002DE1A9F|nr:hypothetical protein [Saccharothrix espanaensis]